MRANKADIDNSPRVEDPCDDSIVVVSNSKDYPVSTNYAGVGIAFQNVTRSRPVRSLYLSIPCK